MFRLEHSCWDCLEPYCPPFDVDSEYFWAALILVLLLMVVDVGYYTRICWDQVVTWLLRGSAPPPILTAHTYRGICLSTSLAADSHSLNKSTGFLRECHFALRAFYLSSYISSAVQTLGVTLGEGSNNVKLRKPISFLQAYLIQTRIVWWDEQSLYLEQKLIRLRDMEVCAVNFSRQMVVGASPQQLLDLLPVCSCKPEVPPEIASWMVCIKIVNRELHASSE